MEDTEPGAPDRDPAPRDTGHRIAPGKLFPGDWRRDRDLGILGYRASIIQRYWFL